MIDNKKTNFFSRLKNKYRIVVLNDLSFEEKIIIKYSLWKYLLVFVLTAFLVVLGIWFLLYYLQFKSFLAPESSKYKKELIHMSLKLDSLEVVRYRQDLYLNNLKTILKGEDHLEVLIDDFSEEEAKEQDLSVSKNDSLFRLSVEKKSQGDYIGYDGEGSTYFFPPVSGEFTEKYSVEKQHFGVDIVTKENEIIKSISSGVVIISNWTQSTGFVIAIQHSDGFISIYKHNSTLLKDIGDFVTKGESIGIVGNSGEFSSGPHLHFELWKDGKSVNPINYISF